MGGDSALRAITNDGAFRVMAVNSTDMVRAAIATQQAQGRTGEGLDLSRAFAELLTGAVLVRETMAPDLRVQTIVGTRRSKSRLVADAHPNGDTRGLIQLVPGDDRTPLDEGAFLQVMRTLNDGTLHQGIVEVPAGGGMSEALMQYMQASEQVFSVIAVGCAAKDGEIVAAGGYIVQLLPEAKQSSLQVMTDRLGAFEKIDRLLERGAAEPARLLNELLHGMKYTLVGESGVRFRCACSEERLAASLATLPRADILELTADGRMLDIQCDFCGREYHLAPEMLRGLLVDS